MCHIIRASQAFNEWFLHSDLGRLSGTTFRSWNIAFYYILFLADSPAPVPLYLFWALLKRRRAQCSQLYTTVGIDDIMDERALHRTEPIVQVVGSAISLKGVTQRLCMQTLLRASVHIWKSLKKSDNNASATVDYSDREERLQYIKERYKCMAPHCGWQTIRNHIIC